MKLTDDNHKVARLIKDLEQRVSDLEEASRETSRANPLVTVYDTVGVGDRFAGMTTHDLGTAGTWNETGWNTSAWGSYE